MFLLNPLRGGVFLKKIFNKNFFSAPRQGFASQKKYFFLLFFEGFAFLNPDGGGGEPL